MLVPIVSTAPMIMHRWDQKAKQQMLDNQQGRVAQKEIRNPQADYEASMYRTADGYGFPVIGFKACIVGAARFFGKDVTMTGLRQFLFMRGVPSADRSELLTPIIGEPKMREDMVRISRGGTDLRYRAEFLDWSASLDITYVNSMLSQESVLALIDAAGMGVGIGDWRPEKSGQHGTFMLDLARQVEIIK
jgi:hypothetical protein